MITILYMLGFGSLVTTVAYWVYYTVYDYLYKRMFTSIVVESLDPVYNWLLQYLTQKNYLTVASMTNSVVRTVKKKSNWWEPETAKEKPKVEYYPAPGTHFFSF